MTFEEFDALWNYIPTIVALNNKLRRHNIYDITVRTICGGIIDKSVPLETYKDMPKHVYESIETLYSEVPPVMLKYRLGLLDIQELPF